MAGKGTAAGAAVAPSLRWMVIQRDLPEVLRIEQQSFDSPWGEQDFQNHAGKSNCIGMVAEHGGAVVGFMVYKLHYRSLEILKLAVDPACRLRGIGRGMVDKLKSKLVLTTRTRLLAVVSEYGLGAHLFLQACGFNAVRVLRGHYEDGIAGYEFRYRQEG